LLIVKNQIKIKVMATNSNDSANIVKRLIFLEKAGHRRRRAILKEIDIFKELSILKVEYLSLKGVGLKNLNFSKYFINLWYLDVRDNQV
jgi:hypothetical protein